MGRLVEYRVINIKFHIGLLILSIALVTAVYVTEIDIISNVVSEGRIFVYLIATGGYLFLLNTFGMNYVQKTIQNNAKKLCDRTDKQSNVLSEQVGIEAELEMSKVQLEVRNKELEKIVISLETTINKAETATKAKSDFMANISHELRTPMNSILSF